LLDFSLSEVAAATSENGFQSGCRLSEVFAFTGQRYKKASSVIMVWLARYQSLFLERINNACDRRSGTETGGSQILEWGAILFPKQAENKILRGSEIRFLDGTSLKLLQLFRSLLDKLEYFRHGA
jgi:hypothetical protein